MKRFIVLLFVAASSGSLPPPATESAPLVAAPVGTLRGAAVGDIHVFKGIPYALPPTGPMRWKPPVPVPNWKNTREATEFGFVCVQPKPQPGSIYSWEPRPMSEDCLTLNIWAPAGARKAPVFFWIHGGALTSGAGSDRLRTPGRVPFDIDFQVVTVDHSGPAAALGSTNGLHVHGQ